MEVRSDRHLRIPQLLNPAQLLLTSLVGISDSLQIIGPANEVATDLDLKLCLTLTRQWLRDCKLQHAQCVSKGADTLPTRVLDIGDRSDAAQIRLYESAPGQCDEYVALSYCWGKFGNLTTTKGNIADRKRGIPWEVMPKSFQDAIEITRGLGIGYLWIDALCIVQDDASDWEREAARMAEVYENATLTIATDAALDPTRGILTPRQIDLVSTIDSMNNAVAARRPYRRAAIETFSVVNKLGNVNTVYAREPLSHEDIALPRSHHDITYPLMTRAWTLQERLLSRRTLHVTASELIWECKTTLYCECGTIAQVLEYLNDGSSPKIGFDKAMHDIIEECQKSLNTDTPHLNQQQKKPRIPITTRAWTMLIGEYSNRTLTFESDRLPAILALARRFSLTDELATPRTYLAGLWLEDLPWLLCWRTIGRRFEKRPDVYCGPSWSWVSVITPVIWYTQIYDAESRVDILQAATFPEGADNPFGRVKGARIVVKGQVQMAKVCLDVENDEILGLSNDRGERILFVPDQNPDADETPNRHPSPPSPVSLPRGASLQRDAASLYHGEEVVCLWVLHRPAADDVYGLVLAAPVEESIMRSIPGSEPKQPTKTFERVGVITGKSRRYLNTHEVPASSWFAGAEVQTISII